MSISPYSLNMLYQNGIIDYIPMDLAMPSPIGFMGAAQNPYLNSAMSGAAFQNYGQGDAFCYTGNTNIAYDNSSIGIKNNSANNAFSLQGVGDKFSGNFYGISGVGTKSSAADNAYGLSGIGTRAGNAEMNAWGISGQTQQQVGQVINSAANSSWFKPLAGLGLLLIAGLSIKHAFKSKKAAKKAAEEVSKKNRFTFKNKSKKLEDI